MTSPEISIITPFKNSSAFLSECLESIIDQSYSNWELLIVNDHSTDHSRQIVERFARNDVRIKLFDNQNKGIIEALRLAFSKSSGTYITRMDSDDIMHPDKLKLMYNQLKTNGRGHVALGLVKYFNDLGLKEGYLKYETWLNSLTKKGTNFSEIYKECVVPSPCWMLHRDDLITCEAFQPDRYPEDYDLTFRFYKYGLSCIPSEYILHHWRDYSTRTSRTDSNYALNHFLDLKVDYFLELEYDNNRPLALWGAGEKGKYTAKILDRLNIPFHWICDNPNKIGKDIYGIPLESFEHLRSLNKPQSIITVANELEQQRIIEYFAGLDMKPMLDYYFFC